MGKKARDSMRKTEKPADRVPERSGMKTIVARLRRGLHRFGLAQNSRAPFINIVALVALALALDLETLAGSRIQKDRGSKGD